MLNERMTKWPEKEVRVWSSHSILWEVRVLEALNLRDRKNGKLAPLAVGPCHRPKYLPLLPARTPVSLLKGTVVTEFPK